MKRAKVSELKAHLSAYLSDVRGGETVIVCDRNTPIARLVPYDDDADEFVVNEPRRTASALGTVRGVKPRRRIDVVRLLRTARRVAAVGARVLERAARSRGAPGNRRAAAGGRAGRCRRGRCAPTAGPHREAIRFRRAQCA